METKQQLSETKNEVLDLKRKNKDLKDKIYKVQLENRDKIHTIKQLTTELELAKQQAVELTIELAKKDSDIESITRHRDRLRNKVSNLTGELRNFRLEKKAKESSKVKQLQDELESKDKQIRHLRRTRNNVVEVAPKLSYSDLLESVLTHVAVHNVAKTKSFMADLTRKIDSLTNQKAAATKAKSPYTEEKFGFLTHIQGTLTFYDLEGVSYVIDKIVSPQTRLLIQMPCKAYINPATLGAEIVAIYTDMAQKEKEVFKAKPKEKEMAKEDEEEKEVTQTFSKDIEVLVIGAKNKEKYLSTLKELGVTPIWFNPFEGSLHRLDGYISHADIVLACKEHISHSTLSHLDLESPKTVLLTQGSAKYVRATTRLLIRSLNLG